MLRKHMEENMTGCRSIKVSCGVAAVNDWDNRIIPANEVFVTVNGSRPYVKKEDGFFIFTKACGNTIRIKAEGTGWQEYEKDVEVGRNREVYIRLLPNEQHQASQNSTVITGYGRRGQTVRLLFSCRKRPYIASRGKTEGILRIYHEGDNFLEGMEFMAEAEKKISFTLSMNEGTVLPEEGESFGRKRNYWMKQWEGAAILPENTRLKRMFTVPVDNKGRFYFLVPKEAESDGEFELSNCDISVPAREAKYRKIEFLPHQKNQIIENQ